MRAIAGRRQRAIEQAVPPLLDHLSAVLRAGGTLRSGIVAAGQHGVLAPALRAAAARADAGSSLRAAVGGIAETHPVPAVRLAVAAMVLGLDTGGAQASTLDSVAQAVRDQLALVHEVRALSASARASALVIALAPVGFTAVVAMIDPAIAASLLTTGFGRRCLVGGLALDALGLLWIRRIIRVTS